MINAVEKRALRNICGVTLRDRMRYSVVSERCGVKYYVVKRESFGGVRSCKKGNVSRITTKFMERMRIETWETVDLGVQRSTRLRI